MAVESTGVYWMSVFNALEEELDLEEILVVNGCHIRRCRDARLTSGMLSGSPTSFRRGWYTGASFPIVTIASWSATAKR